MVKTTLFNKIKISKPTVNIIMISVIFINSDLKLFYDYFYANSYNFLFFFFNNYNFFSWFLAVSHLQPQLCDRNVKRIERGAGKLEVLVSLMTSPRRFQRQVRNNNPVTCNVSAAPCSKCHTSRHRFASMPRVY